MGRGYTHVPRHWPWYSSIEIKQILSSNVYCCWRLDRFQAVNGTLAERTGDGRDDPRLYHHGLHAGPRPSKSSAANTKVTDGHGERKPCVV